MPDHKREEFVIKEFCLRLSALMQTPVRPIEWPELAGTGQIDAMIEREGARWALDHRHLNTYKNQREHDVRFLAIRDYLEEAFKGRWDGYDIDIIIPIRKMPKSKQKELWKLLESGIQQEMPNVPEDGKPHPVKITGLKHSIHISRTRWHHSSCFVSQEVPEKHTAERREDMKTAIKDKSKQLAPLKSLGFRTTLLLDTRDLSTLNAHTIATDFGSAIEQSDHSAIDEVFLFDNPRKSLYFILPLKFRGVLPPDMRWLDEFERAQCALIWGRGFEGPPFVQIDK